RYNGNNTASDKGDSMKTTVNGIDIKYDDVGPADAPALIFIHGFPLNRTMWQPQMEALKGRYRLIAYDLRGHGESSLGEEDFTMERFVQDLLGLMEALRIEKATLCALSMGGYIALNAAESHPERFNALVLCDTQCSADTPEGKAKRNTAIKAVQRDGVEPFAEGLLGKLFAPGSFETNPQAVAAAREMITATSALSLERSLRAMRERDETCSKLPSITVPVLVVVGEADKISPPESARYLHENIEHSRLAVIKNAGHLSNLENPDAFNDALKSFLDTLAK
ncbi:MAG: alpha/beta fold hydrolase, partial [Campylobacterales bacterium]